MSGDLLDGGRPKRLVRRQGYWYLEMHRLVSAGDGVFQPRTIRVEGRAAIVDTLRRSKHGRSLAESAAEIVATQDPDIGDSFDAVEGTWVPSSIAPSYIKQLGAKDVRTPAEAALVAELTVLRAAYEGLMDRVARLEQQRLGSAAPVLSAASRAASTWDRPAPPMQTSSREKEPGGVGALRVLDSDRSGRGGAAPEGSPPAAREPAVSAPVAPVPAIESAQKQLKLLPINVLTTTLKQLCGSDVPMKEVKKAPSGWIDAPRRYFASWLVDDDGHEVGVILCDVEAVARLGGALLMLPAAEIDSQVSLEAPTEDAMSATAEVCNNLSGPLNQIPGNLHVRTTPIEQLDELMPGWVRTPRGKFVCAHAGGGVVALLAR